MNDLQLLLAELRADAEPEDRPSPPTAPRDGQTVDRWLLDVAGIRAAHDDAAIEHRRRVDAACEKLFGISVDRLLPASHDLTRREVQVPLAPDLALSALVPGLPDRVGAARTAVPGAPPREHVTVRVTSPPEPTSAVVRLHGGAFWMGGGLVAGVVDRPLIDHVAVAANAAVLDVDYRLAPEYPYPAAMVDSLAVIDAVRAGSFGPVTGPIALLGTSSGGNNAVLTARLEAMRGHTVAALGLVVPSVMLSAGPQSAALNPEAWTVRRGLLRAYLGDLAEDDPWISPGVLDRLDGLPPTFAAVAEFDEVAAGGQELCAAVRAGGQAATSTTYPMTHVVATPDVEAAYIRDVGAFLRGHLRECC